MKAILLTFLASGFFAVSAWTYFAHDDQGNHYGWFKDGDGGPGEIHGAPGPVAGAGLPVLAVGYGVYCLLKRRRKKLSGSNSSS